MTLDTTKEQATQSDLHPTGSCCTRLTDFGVALAGTQVLRAVNLHVHCGELTAVVGPNGAGKTTLFRAILGELPHTGQLSFLNPSNGSGLKRRPHVGYVPQKLEFDTSAPITVLDVFAGALGYHPLWLGHTRRSRFMALESLSLVKSEHLVNRRLGLLSGGEQQRVLLSLALTPVPHILLLDEPVSGVDPSGIDPFYLMISDLRDRFDMSIILASHDLQAVARYADRMIFLNQTVLCDGSPAEVLAHNLVRQTFGTAVADASRIKPVVRPRHAGDQCCRGQGESASNDDKR
jgi:zinc transport system ATP-binding protein